MKTTVKPLILTVIMGVSALALSACARSYGPPMAVKSVKTNHANHPYKAKSGTYGRHPMMPQGRYGQKTNHKRHKNKNKSGLFSRLSGPAYDGLGNRLQGRKKLAYQVPPAQPGFGQFQRWIDYEPQYLLYPGDQLDIVVASAPEMSRTLTIGPDGRIVMPYIKPIMAAGRDFGQVERDLSAELAGVLRDPSIAITPRAYGPQQIYIGGEVGQQGTYTLPGPVGVLEGVIMAGGLRPSAKTGQVAVLRRAPNGGMMMRVVNLKNGMRNIREYNDNMQLRRGDIVFVPRTQIAEIGNWMQAFRSALPVDFNLSYQFGSNGGGTTVISP